MIKHLAFNFTLITSLLFISMAQARTAKLYCQSESQTWPQSGKIYSSNKIMFLRIEFSNDGYVKIYQGNQEPFGGKYDTDSIISDSKTEKGFERNLIIDRKTGGFTDRYYVFNKGKEETAWIDRGSCDI